MGEGKTKAKYNFIRILVKEFFLQAEMCHLNILILMITSYEKYSLDVTAVFDISYKNPSYKRSDS